MMGWMQRAAARLGVCGGPRAKPLSLHPTVAVGIDFSRQPDPRWQEALDRAYPPSDRLGRLVIVWDAGDRWQPIHRWTILQIQPWQFVDKGDPGQFYKRILNGPHVRTNAELHYVMANVDGESDWHPRVRGPYARGVDRLCYETYHALRRQGYKGLPRRFWVIQGHEGGQPFDLSTAEAMLWSEQNRTHYSAGDLPYVEFDQRVIQALESYDLWKYANDLGDPETFAVRAMVGRWNTIEREAHKLQWKFWTDRAEQMAPEVQFAMRQDGMHLMRWDRPGYKEPEPDMDAMEDAYINEVSMEASA